MPDQQKKIVHFYLTEMLNHVKSMNEHRLGPIPHNIIKRLVYFITATGDAAERFEKLKSIPSLAAFQGFLQVNMDKISGPGFRMSALMSALESDSERLSQILLSTLATKEQQFRLSDELLAVGFDLELEKLYEVHHDKETKRPVETAVTLDGAKIAPEGEEFDRVGDVAGFFSRRGRKTSSERIPMPSERTPSEDEAALSTSSDLREQPGAFADAATFVVELRRTLVKMRSLLNGWSSAAMDQRFLGEAADGFGELRKLANVYSFGDLSVPIGRFEKRLNDVADNRDDQRLALTEKTVEVCRNVLDIIEQADYSDYGTSRNNLLTALKRLFSDFEASLTVRARPSRISSDVSVDAPPVDDAPVDGKELRLDTSRLSTEDYQVFKDEVYSYFDSLDSALLDLRKDRANLSSLRMLQLSLKGLQTASRVLRFGLFLDLVTVSWSGINEIVRRRGTLSEDAHRQLVSLRSVLRLLTEGQPVSENSYHDLKRSLDNLSQAAPEMRESTVADTSSVDANGKNAVLPENVGWVDDMQEVIDAHKDTISVLPVRADEPIDKPKKSETVPAAEPPVEPVADLAAHLIESDQTVIRPVARQKEREPSSRSDDRRALLDVMAHEGAGTDLSMVNLETFGDRISKDPQDIPEIKHGRIRKAVKRQPTKIETPVVTAPTVEPTEAADGTGLMLEENNFQTVDREILDIFIQESEGFFRVFERALSKLNTNAKDESAIKDFERTGHSLKSSSRMLGFDRISGLAGVLELISERYFEKEIEISESVIALFADVVRALQGLFRNSKVEVRSILVRLMELEKKLGAPNILTRNIPGAADLEKMLAADVASIPKDEGEGRTANYFASIGVDDEIVQIFREESASYFRLIRHALDSVKSNTAGVTVMRDIEKAAHSLRSSAKMLGFVKIADLVRPLEALAERHNKAPFDLTPEAMAALDGVVSKLESLLRGQDVDTSGETAALNAVVESITETLKTSGATRVDGVMATEDAGLPAKTRKRVVKKKKPIEIPDFQIQNEPIFKRLHVEDALLDEMARVTGNA